MPNFTCYNNCCKITIEPYTIDKNVYHKNRSKKAGIFMCTKEECIEDKKILLVQSRGNLWGLPKGTFEKDEDSISCAIRELEEETGIKLSKEVLKNNTPFNIKDQAYYYYLSTPILPISLQIKNVNNDVNGIAWFKLSCLKKLINNKLISLNYHSKLCFKKYFSIDF